MVEQVRYLIRWIGIAQFVAVLSLVAVVRAQSQSQETINAVNLERLASLESRTRAIEAIRAESRLALIENDMFEVKWLGRTVASLLAAQLISGGVRRRKELIT